MRKCIGWCELNLVKVSCSMHESTGVEITFTVVFMTCYTVSVNRLNTSVFILTMSSNSCFSLHVKEVLHLYWDMFCSL
jgi:hypothetical protein